MRTKHMISRLKQIWAEIDYANRRRLEIQTGWSLAPAPSGSTRRVESS